MGPAYLGLTKLGSGRAVKREPMTKIFALIAAFALVAPFAFAAIDHAAQIAA